MQHNNRPVKLKPALISRLEIRSLFGRYDYNLVVPLVKPQSAPKVAIIYGDNGTGKTTILKLLFHLLSPSQEQAHKTFVASVPFNRFSVEFSDKTRIEAFRKKGKLTGKYEIVIAKGKSILSMGEIGVTEEGLVRDSTLSGKAQRVLDNLSELGISIYFIGDDRILQTDEIEAEEEEALLFRSRSSDYERFLNRSRGERDPIALDRRDVAVTLALRRAATWLHKRLMQASRRGEAEAQQIYANIVETINKSGISKVDTYTAETTKLIRELAILRKRSHSFAKLGLIPEMDVKRFIKALRDTTEEGLPLVLQVVRSFVDSQKARLDTLNELYNILSQFLSIINGFYRDKNAILDAREGISIIADTKKSLSPENLSSGEKQILLLFCNVLMASESASLFIIDEPELSLNIKWQRKLIDSLFDIAGRNQCQFFIATHSIELLTKHREQVIKLGSD